MFKKKIYSNIIMDFEDFYIWFIQDGQAIKDDFYNSGERVTCINNNDLIRFIDFSLLVFKLLYENKIILISTIDSNYYNINKNFFNIDNLFDFENIHYIDFKKTYGEYMILIDNTMEYIKITSIKPHHIESLKLKINNYIKNNVINIYEKMKENNNCYQDKKYNFIFSQYDKLVNILNRLNDCIFKIRY